MTIDWTPPARSLRRTSPQSLRPPVVEGAIIPASPLPLVKSYDVRPDDRALLRWSLWEAQKKRCYICDDPYEFRRIEIDHIIPKATATKDFNAKWTNFGHGMRNDGVHAISNLRACCENCNSPRVKGSIMFSDTTLDLHLAKSTRISKDALKIQRKILRSGDVGKSAIILASARTDDQYELLWDLDVNQALMAALHRSSRVLEKGETHRVPTIDRAYQIELATEGKSARLLAAMQLASGLSPADLAADVAKSAVKVLDQKLEAAAIAGRNQSAGPAAGTTDWSGVLFTVSIESVGIEEDVVSYSCRIELDDYATVPISAQSADGSSLQDSQLELSVEGYLVFTATTELGDLVRTRPSVEDAELFDYDIVIED